MTVTNPPDGYPHCGVTDEPTDAATTHPMSRPVHEIHGSLRAGEDGHLPSMAAVELLLAHGSLIDRQQGAGLIDWTDPEHQPPTGWIDWQRLDDQLSGRTDLDGRLAGASRCVHNVLRVATSLTTRHQIALNDVLHALDSTNTSLVAQAIVDADGHGHCVTIRVGPPAAAERLGLVPSDPAHAARTSPDGPPKR